MPKRDCSAMWAYHDAAEELLSGTVTMDFVYEATGRLIFGTRPILTTGLRTETSMERWFVR